MHIGLSFKVVDAALRAKKSVVADSNNTITATTGSFNVIGQTTNLITARILPSANAAFALSGQAVLFPRTYILSAAQGSFTQTGQAANLLNGPTVTAAQATFILSGQSANLTVAHILTAANAAFALTGQAANLVYSGSSSTYTLTAAQGSFTLTGDSMTPTVNYILPSANAAFALTGQAANFLYGRAVTAANGVFTLTGQAAALVYSNSGSPYTLTASQGSFALTGQAANLNYYHLIAAQGSFTLSGQAATLTYSGAGGGDAAWTTAFVARTSGLTTPQTNAVKTFMNTLATAGLDAKCEFAHILALPGTNWTLNLKSTSYTAVNHGATHTDLLGIIGDGTAAYVDTGCTPSSGLTVASVNSHSLFYAQSNLDNDNAPSMCIDSLNAHNCVTSSDFGSDFVATIAKGASLSWANPDTIGATAYFGTSRTSSTATALYHNGTSVATSSTGAADSVFDSGALQYLGGANTSFAISTLGFGAMFSGLNATEHGTLQTAVQTLLHALNSTAYP